MIDPTKPGDTPDGRPSLPRPPRLSIRPISAEEQGLIRRRQRGAARMTGLALAALAILIFLITVAKQVK